jgi:hypothetical protein
VASRFLASRVAGTSDVAANLFLTASEGEEPQPEIVDWGKVEAVAQATLRMVLRQDWMDPD